MNELATPWSISMNTFVLTLQTGRDGRQAIHSALYPLHPILN